MSKYELCPECKQTTGQLKRHLVDVHSWRYTEDSPRYPIPVIKLPNFKLWETLVNGKGNSNE